MMHEPVYTNPHDTQDMVRGHSIMNRAFLLPAGDGQDEGM
jgi:hypothetical protein